MEKRIRLSKSSLSNKEKEAVMRILDEEYLGMGKEVKVFEDNLTEFFGRPAVCVSSGTAALHLSLQASGIGFGDEVLVQSLTYIATIQAITATGAKPIFCDVNKYNMNIDLNDVKNKISAKTKAIVPVHYAGSAGEIDDLYELANDFKIHVIEDAAHAFGSYHKGKRIGSFGNISCFSFDGIKNITSGEGGCIVSANKNFIENVKDIRLLGVQKDSDKRYSNNRSYDFDVSEQGWRYHMSNIMAAIGNIQLERFDKLNSTRKKLVERYVSLLKNSTDVKILKIEYDQVFMHIFPIILNNSIDRKLLREKLNSVGISTGVHYFPNHFLTLYKKNIFLENTENIYSRLLTLPLHFDLTLDDVDFVVENLKKFL